MTEQAKTIIDVLKESIAHPFYFDRNEMVDIISALCDEIQGLKSENEWKHPSCLPEIGTIVLVKFSHTKDEFYGMKMSGYYRFETDTVMFNHEGGKILSMTGYEDVTIYGWKLIN